MVLHIWWKEFWIFWSPHLCVWGGCTIILLCEEGFSCQGWREYYSESGWVPCEGHYTSLCVEGSQTDEMFEYQDSQAIKKIYPSVFKEKEYESFVEAKCGLLYDFISSKGETEYTQQILGVIEKKKKSFSLEINTNHCLRRRPSKFTYIWEKKLYSVSSQ